jgi:hypothetical protein
MDYLTTFAQDSRTLALCVLILLDLISGVVAAIRAGTFQGEKLWAFLKTDVLAFAGYALLYTLTAAGLLQGLTALGIDVGFGQGATVWGLFVVAVGSLLTSIRKNVQTAAEAGPHPPQP